MAELGVLPDVIERCLNHTEAVKVRRIYRAFEILGQKLAEIRENITCD